MPSNYNGSGPSPEEAAMRGIVNAVVPLDTDAARNPVVRIDGGEAMADSRDVAAYFGKDHKRVLQTIRELHCSPEFHRRNFVPFKIKDLSGESTSHVMMTKDGFTFLGMGFTGEKAARLKERWIISFNAMEAELRARPAPATFSVPKTLSEALRLAADLAEKVDVQTARAEVAETKVIEAAPKAAFYDAYVNADGLFGLQNGGRALQCHPNKFIQWLKRDYLFHQGGALLPRVQYTKMGLFEVKMKMDGDQPRPQTYITPKGITYFARRVPPGIRIDGGAGVNVPEAAE